jgi:hypothetical protein
MSPEEIAHVLSAMGQVRPLEIPDNVKRYHWDCDQLVYREIHFCFGTLSAHSFVYITDEIFDAWAGDFQCFKAKSWSPGRRATLVERLLMNFSLAAIKSWRWRTRMTTARSKRV